MFATMMRKRRPRRKAFLVPFYSVFIVLIYLLSTSEIEAPSDLQQHLSKQVAYAITVTNCDNTDFLEGAAVLAYSIQTQLSYDMIVILHPEAVKHCQEPLQQLGYRTLVRDVLVRVEDIQGAFLKSKIRDNGCCGERELLKLEAWTLEEYDLVVLLDSDFLFLQSLDNVLQAMMRNDVKALQPQLQRPQLPIPDTIQLLYTIDYAMVAPRRKVKPVQGGFVVLRPNRTIYEDFREIVREGDFREQGGWGGRSGKFWGSMTFQGLIPYYFLVMNKASAIELNRCTHGNMCPPGRETIELANGTKIEGQCFTLEDDCEDCRERSLDTIVSAHYTNCLKPWHCVRHMGHNRNTRLCRQLHHAWFAARSKMELSWGRSGRGTSKPWDDSDYFYGYCSAGGHRSYEPIMRPYHSIV